MMKVLLTLIVLVSLISLVLTACGEQSTTVTTTAPAATSNAPAATTKATSTTTSAPAVTTTSPDAAKYGGILKIISRGSGPVNIGYPGKKNSPSDPNVGRPMVERFMSLDEKGELVPWLATSWEYSTDYKVLTLHLRKGVKFHDGTDFDAEAAKYCIDLVRVSPESSSFKNITSVETPDAYTIRINVDAYDASLLFTVQSASWMVSPTAIKTLGDEAKLHPVGTGPFKFVSYKRDQLLKMERFDDYWQEGKPYLDGIDRYFIADTVTAIASMKAGEAHVITDTPASDVAALQALKFDTVTSWSAVQGFAADSANADSPFSNIKVRRAVAYAVNNQAVAKVVGFGFYPAANQLAPSDTWQYNPAVVGYPYNPDKAKQLLAEAGYSNGLSATITFRSDPRHLDVFTAVQGYFSKVGINAKLDAADSARLLLAQTGGWKNGFVAFDVPASTGFDPGNALRQNLSSVRSKFISVNVPKDYDDKLTKANAETDPAKRALLLQELGKIIIDDYCMVFPVYVGANTSAKVPWARDINLVQYSFHEWNPENVWLEK